MTREINTGSKTFLGELLTLKNSPWSLRAKWALAYHNCSYTETHCQPLISIPYLWYRLNFPSDKLTLPVFFPSNGSRPLRESLAIARMADENWIKSGKPSLFPEDENPNDDIMKWIQAMESALGYGRQRYMKKLMEREETVMTYVPKSMRWIGRFGGASLIRWVVENWFLKKYRDDAGEEGARIAWNKVLERITQVKKRLDNKDKQVYITQDRFTFADIVVAVATMVLEPLRHKWLSGRGAARRCGRDEKLGREFCEVITWRNEVFEKHFPATLMPRR